MYMYMYKFNDKLIDVYVRVRYSCKTLIGMHDKHGRMHPNSGLATSLLAHDSLALIIGLPYDYPYPSDIRQ
jgi:hypothetical protein